MRQQAIRQRPCLWQMMFILSGWICHLVSDASSAADLQSTWRDDASLKDVQLIGSKAGFAVGAHGAIWSTSDGGQTWKAIPSNVSCTLTSVCFLTHQVGWVGGSEVSPYTGLDTGVLLFTEDGGASWQKSESLLPPISHIRFFSLEEGIIVGRPTSEAPSGIVRTSDGGKTWLAVNGIASAPWRTGFFVDPEMGYVAGPEGRLSLVAGEQLVDSKLPPQGLRTIRAITLQDDDSGWLAGDGGLVLRTTGGGVVWENPPRSLPDELRIGIDFRTVAARGENVWLAGSPGSVVWHSPNGGKTWQRFLTGQTAPLNSLRFASDTVGVAVGEFGTIIRTEDAGRTWQSARGSGRRAAVLSLQTRPSKLTPAWITKLSSEQGYRSVVWMANRQDMGPMAGSGDVELRLQSAVLQAGGNSSDIYWQLPVLIPGLEYSADKLIEDWQKRTEGKLAPSLIAVLVRQLRTWKPSVIIIDQPASDDAASQVLFDAVLRATEQAADATRFVEQRELTGLPVWKVDRIYMQLGAGSGGDAIVDLDEYLARRRMSVRLASSSSLAIVRSDQTQAEHLSAVRQIAYRWIDVDGKPTTDTALKRDFFAGLSISPGTEARRDLAIIDDSDLERMQKLVQKHRNLQAIAEKTLDDPRMAGQMIGQLGGLVRDMDARQGAELLRGLSEQYRERSMFDLVEATNLELIRRYPQEPAALDAMRWLLQFWISSETAWQRARRMTSETARISSDVQANAKLIQQAADTLASGIGGVNTADYSEEAPVLKQNVRPGQLNRVNLPAGYEPEIKTPKKNGSVTRVSTIQQDWRSGEIREWHKRAADVASQMEVQSPGLFRTPEIQFPLAALRRMTGNMAKSDAIFRSCLTRSQEDSIRALAEREIWLMFSTSQAPLEMVICQRTEEKPRLDGILGDACWQASRELTLTSKPRVENLADDSEENTSLIMMAYDAEFLYLGISATRVPGANSDRPQPGRTRDADLTHFDRITMCLDVDRDYATWYEFEIDQRGWTADRCWEDRRWNPTWYVAANADETHWRIEAAIPWNELTPSAPQRGTVWSIAISRTIPTVGMQTWVHPAVARPRPGSFGLLKFE